MLHFFNKILLCQPCTWSMTSMHFLYRTKPVRYHLRPPLKQPCGICTILLGMKIGHERLSWHQYPFRPHLYQIPNSLPSIQVPQICWYGNGLVISPIRKMQKSWDIIKGDAHLTMRDVERWHLLVPSLHKIRQHAMVKSPIYPVAHKPACQSNIPHLETVRIHFVLSLKNS